MTQFGSVNYDCPKANKGAYSKLRILFRRKAVMQTASSYLFPWGLAEQIQKGIEKINKDKDGFDLPAHLKVRYSLFKYDEIVSGKALEQSAKDALSRMLRNMKIAVNERIHSLFTGEDADKVKDPLATAKVACRRAQDTLSDAKALALMFNLTDQLEAGFLAYEAFIEMKKSDLEQWEKEKKDLDIDEFEASLNANII